MLPDLSGPVPIRCSHVEDQMIMKKANMEDLHIEGQY